ncbi:synaptosomal-associated protein SNAP25-like 29 [Wolffia australiana]
MSKFGSKATIPSSKPTTRKPTAARFSKSNPFDSDSDSEQNIKPVKNHAPEKINHRAQLLDHSGEARDVSSSSHAASASSALRNRYKNDFRDEGGFDNQSVQELESYAAYKAEETTQKLNGCVRIAEDIKDDASRTLVLLHQQGEQITRTHANAADIDHDLSRSEKLLGSLGGMFSKTWKPKKTRQIKGPALIRDDSFKRKASHLEQRERLGLTSNSKERANPRHATETSSTLQKVELEKAKQDDALDDLSNVLGQLKTMALDMGSEVERHNAALDNLGEDVDELNYRVKGANARGRRLLGK